MAKRRRRRHSAIFFFFRPFFFTILFPFCGAFETQRFVGAESLQSSREGGAGLRVPSRVGGGGDRERTHHELDQYGCITSCCCCCLGLASRDECLGKKKDPTSQLSV